MFSQQADYAFRIVSYLSKQPLERAFSMQILSELLYIPARHSTTILQKLTKAHIIQSRRGLYGGYSLTREGGSISFLDVLEAVDGPLTVCPCQDSGFCALHNDMEECPVYRNLSKMHGLVTANMREFTFSADAEPIK